MSDGPHKSLPLRRHWQDLAQRMATPSFPSDQVWEVLPYALTREVLEAPIKEVRDIMSGSLFPELRAEQLEGLRPSCRGSAAANRLIDCAVEVTMSGLTGDAGTHSALRNALEDTACISLRGIEEHYQRNAGSRSAGYVRGRIDEARRRLNCDALASDLLSPSAPKSSRSITLPRRSGVDEGPPL